MTLQWCSDKFYVIASLTFQNDKHHGKRHQAKALCERGFSGDTQAPVALSRLSIFAHVSRNGTVRLNTSLSLVVSGSTQK